MFQIQKNIAKEKGKMIEMEFYKLGIGQKFFHKNKWFEKLSDYLAKPCDSDKPWFFDLYCLVEIKEVK